MIILAVKYRVEFRMHSPELGVAGLNVAAISAGEAIFRINEQAKYRNSAQNELKSARTGSLDQQRNGDALLGIWVRVLPFCDRGLPHLDQAGGLEFIHHSTSLNPTYLLPHP